MSPATTRMRNGAGPGPAASPSLTLLVRADEVIPAVLLGEAQVGVELGCRLRRSRQVDGDSADAVDAWPAVTFGDDVTVRGERVDHRVGGRGHLRTDALCDHVLTERAEIDQVAHEARAPAVGPHDLGELRVPADGGTQRL